MPTPTHSRPRSSQRPPADPPAPGAVGTPGLRRLGPRVALVEQVVQRLREGILGGEFPPGSELPAEGRLAQTLGVSYTVIREAMRTLRSQGLVEISQGRRPRIKPVGSGAVRETLDTMLRRGGLSIRELTEFRLPLECEMAARAAERATPEQVAELETIYARQLTAQTLEEQVAADIAFHELLARAAGNRLFGLVLSSLWDLLWESRRQGILRFGRDSSWQAHRAILDALQAHNPAAARQAMTDHLAGWFQYLE